MRCSESDRALVCPASLVLPRVSRPAGDGAKFGTLVHHWKETGETDPTWADPKHVALLEKKILLSAIERERYWSGGQHEVTFAVHLKERRALRHKGRRESADEWKQEVARGTNYMLTGTIDYLYDDGRVDDLKTGDWPVYAANASQLLSYSLLPWLEAGAPLDWRSTVSITTWKRYPLTGLPVVDEHQITGFDLMDHLDSLLWSVEHPDVVVPSESGCKFCDCKQHCPKWTNLPKG